MKASGKDIFRTIGKEKKRMIALAIIAALGVTMMTGLKAACDDLRDSADRFFDAQNLHDLTVVSTLGLTDEDVSALEGLDGILQAEGAYTETVQLDAGENYVSAVVKTFREDGIDVPYVVEGRLPRQGDEIAVPRAYLTASGKAIGDTLTLLEDTEEPEEKEDTEDLEELEELNEAESPNFVYTTYTIVGVVIDVTSVVNPDGSTSFRSTGSGDYQCFVTPEAVESDYYTAVNLVLQGTKEINTFSEDYDALVSSVKSEIEKEIKERREAARYRQVVDEAEEKLNDAQAKLDDAFGEAREELDEARQELDDGWTEWNDGKQELDEQEADVRAQISDGKQELADGREELESGLKELYDAAVELQTSQDELVANEARLNAEQERLKEGEKELNAGKEELQEKEQETMSALDELLQEQQTNLQQVEAALAELESIINGMQAEPDDGQSPGEGDFPAEQIAQLQQQKEELEQKQELLNAAIAQLEAQKDAARQSFNEAWAQIGSQEETLKAGKQAIEYGLKQIEEGKELLDENYRLLEEKRAEAAQAQTDLDEAEAELAENEAAANKEIEDARQTLSDARQELEDGEEELAEGIEEYEEKKADADEQIADARTEIDDIAACDWYIRDRSALDGYADITSDADCIESIGNIFPILFLLVAVLISLTTITRMVEEHRGLIGTYQALGFFDREICRKFVIYSSTAAIAGGILGNIGGYVILPQIIIVIFHTMYLLPEYTLGYNYLYGIGGILLFYAAIVGATLWSCRSTVRQLPAALMRPRTPRSGSRIFLEKIGPVWRRLSFLNKVTARNLFRYKKRLLMTIFGIAGCTALLLCGFSIKNTVADLMPRQYEEIISYDILAVTAGDDDFDQMQTFLEENEEQIQSMASVEIGTVDIHKLNQEDGGKTLSVQLYVIPEGTGLNDFFTLETTQGESVSISEDGFYLTENIGTMLDISAGDEVSLQDMTLQVAEGKVNCLMEYYLGNSVFVTEKYYEEVFGEYSPNGSLICLKDDVDEAEFADGLNSRSEILSVTSVQELKDGFSQAFALMNMVVYVIIVLAGALAFVVLFTLSTTNISERERELATIKVLGFYDNEVYRYVNKETLILTGIGIAAGLPLGVGFSELLGMALKMPAIVYSPTIHKVSYLLAGGIAFGFALLVDLMTNRILNRIDPIEALKSVE